jgi:RHS repeat-associated protein
LVVDKYRLYLAYGADGGGEISLNNAYRYCGKSWDEEGGLNLYYNNARYYNPVIGRFLQVDPKIDLAHVGSPYVYSGDSPILYSDRKGRARAVTATNPTGILTGPLGERLYQVQWDVGLQSSDLFYMIPVFDLWVVMIDSHDNEWQVVQQKDGKFKFVDVEAEAERLTSLLMAGSIEGIARFGEHCGASALEVSTIAKIIEIFNRYQDPKWLIDRYVKKYRSFPYAIDPETLRWRLKELVDAKNAEIRQAQKNENKDKSEDKSKSADRDKGADDYFLPYDTSVQAP